MKILIIFGSGIGDFIMFTPVMDLLMKKESNLSFYGIFRNQTVAEIFTAIIRENNMNLQDVIIDSYWEVNNLKLLKKVYKLREENIDLCIIGWPHMGRKSAFISWLSGAKMRVGHMYEWGKLKFFKNSFLTDVVEDMDEHYVLKNIRLVENVIGNINNFSLLFPSVNDVEGIPLELFSQLQKNYIVFHVGCNKSQKFRRWPLSHFSELADLLIKNMDINIISIFGPDEQNEEILFRNMVINKREVFCITKLNIFAIAKILKQALFVVSNDSGISHISAALRRPVFTIFGPANEKHTSPWGFDDLVIKKDLQCRPCYNKPAQKVTCKHRECLFSLKPYEVYKFIIEKLNQEIK